MDHLSQLPPELLQQILGHLSASASTSGTPGSRRLGIDRSPSSSSLHSALPLSAPYLGLSSLAATSRHFHRHVAPLLHSLVCIDSFSHLTAFVEACTRPPKILRICSPRRIFLNLGAEGGAPKKTSTALQNSRWSPESIQRLFASSRVRELDELHVSGVESTSALLRVLDAWVASTRGSDAATDADKGLKTLEIKADRARRDIDGERAARIEGLFRDLANLAIEPDANDDREIDPKSSRTPTSPAKTAVSQQPCSLLALLDSLSSSLQDLSFSHFAFSAPPPSRLGDNFGRLRHLSLHYCDISPPAFFFLLEGSRIEFLELVSCSGLTRDGIIAIAQRQGQHLRSLRLEADTMVMDHVHRPSYPRTLSAPSSSPPNSPGRHQQPSSLPVSPLNHILDSILPYTPNLLHLTWSGPLASSQIDLSVLTPPLRILGISQCPIWSTSSTLYTLFSGPTRPLHLQTLIVDRPTPLNCSPSSEPDGPGLELQEVWGLARSKEVELGGSLFECLNERMRWADEVGLREANRGEQGIGREEGELRSSGIGTGRRRKRPSLC